MNILVTGGCGFIGSALVRYLLNETSHSVLNLDALTYAGSLASVAAAAIAENNRYQFVRMDVCDEAGVRSLIKDHQPDAIIHLAAESHVDRSIDGPAEFIRTNVLGTGVLLEAARKYWVGLPRERRNDFRLLHVSTDEVFGALAPDDSPFTETSPYFPSSPYAASKASSDHLVRAWHRTYGLPTIITNCSNNYGPFQFPEKLIPHMIFSALAGKPLPLYGDGRQVRDWLYVNDHARALLNVLQKGKIGDTYNVGAHCEISNLELVKRICTILDELAAPVGKGLASYSGLITFVADRPGHDTRYAINAAKIERELDWHPLESLESGLRKTVGWYLENDAWRHEIATKGYQIARLGHAAGQL